MHNSTPTSPAKVSMDTAKLITSQLKNRAKFSKLKVQMEKQVKKASQLANIEKLRQIEEETPTATLNSHKDIELEQEELLKARKALELIRGGIPENPEKKNISEHAPRVVTEFTFGFSKMPKLTDMVRNTVSQMGTNPGTPTPKRDNDVNMFGITEYKQNSEVFRKSTIETVNGKQHMHFVTEDAFTFMRVNHEVSSVKQRTEHFRKMAQDHFSGKKAEDLICYDEELEDLDKDHSRMPKKLTKEDKEKIQVVARKAAKKITMIRHKQAENDMAMKVLTMVDTPSNTLRFGSLLKNESP